MASCVRMGVKEILRHFKQLEDPRSSVNLLHPLDSVVVIAIMAVLAGANGPTAIAKWANMKSEVLLKLLDLPHGIPQKDVFRRVLATLKPDAFQACFTMWLPEEDRSGHRRGRRSHSEAARSHPIRANPAGFHRSWATTTIWAPVGLWFLRGADYAPFPSGHPPPGAQSWEIR